MTSTQYVNGASPAAGGKTVFDSMAGSANEQIFLNQMSAMTAELAALRLEIAGLSRQVTKIEALDTHNDLEKLSARVDAQAVRIQGLENDKARYEGRAETWKYIVTGLTILTGIMSAVSMFIAFKK